MCGRIATASNGSHPGTRLSLIPLEPCEVRLRTSAAMPRGFTPATETATRFRAVAYRCIGTRGIVPHVPSSAPLREPTYFILVALLDQPRHGYAVADEVEAMSNGRVRLTAGTLYGALDRLLSEGLVEVEREETVQGRRRRYYRLSDQGRDRVTVEIERMEQAVAAAGAKLRKRSRPSTPKVATT